MKRALLVLATTVLLLTTAQAAQLVDNDPQRLLKAAQNTELVDGNPQAAIKLYQAIVDRFAETDRSAAATALLRMAECYARLGMTGEAVRAYSRVVAQFADQPEAVKLARSRTNSAPAGAPSSRRIWTLPEGTQSLGAVSADGRYLGYVRWSADQPGGVLVVHDFRAQTDRPLTTPGKRQSPQSCAFSGGGARVAFALWSGGHVEVRVRDVAAAEGDEGRVLWSSDDVASMFVDDWSPDGRWLAVHFQRKDRTSAIGLISTGTGALRTLKTTGWMGPTRVRFTPDGRSVAFDLPADDTRAQRDIFLLDVDGARENAVVRDAVQDTLVGLADGGTRLLYLTSEPERTSLWAIGLSHGRPRGAPELLRSNVPDSVVGVTASGSVYMLQTPAKFVHDVSDIQIGAFDFSTGRFTEQPVSFVPDFIGSNASPDWSRDGTSVAYVSTRRNGTVIVTRSMTGKLLGEVEPAMQIYASDPAAVIRWAPDGRSFVAQGIDAKGRGGLHRVDADTGMTTPLAIRVSDNEVVRGGTWSPDGTKLYYQHRADLHFNAADPARDSLVELDVSTGRTRQVFQSAGFWDFWMSPDGASAIVRNSGATGPRTVALVLVRVADGEQKELMRVEGGSLGVWAWGPHDSVIVSKEAPSGAGPVREFWRVSLPSGAANKLNLALEPGVSAARTSPDGVHVAFVRRTTPVPDEVWVLENVVSGAGSRAGK